MSSPFRSTAVALAVVLSACGEGEPVMLEAVAADCASEAPQHLDRLPSGSMVLNAYFLQEEATRDVRRGLPESAVVEEVLAKAAALGVRAVRTNGHNDAVDKVGDSAIQVGPLQYDEVAFQGLDRVLARARVHGVRLVLTLGNYWDAYGGARQYVAWAGLPGPVEGDPRFFTEPAVVAHYKAHVARVLNRVNTVDGIRYGDHPAVLAWELLNEPRGWGLDREGARLRAWVDDVAREVKAQAPGHLVGTGEEGFEPSPEGYDATFWAAVGTPMLRTPGSSFTRNTASPFIDFASVHFYPEAWGLDGPGTAMAGARWIVEHAAIARSLGKPLFVGELGLRNEGSLDLSQRRALYRGWLECLRKQGVGGGALWMFANDSRPDAWDAHTFYFRDGTVPEDPVNRYADLIIEAAGAVRP
ncbi:glycoside hydrolase 5 family protein [Pyxidicoccus xibeiensis]|uniref:glycoside hydrolase 5 family protein n=1 Tax=Pyxidicoccus xibeiensis TaxID=2906759 RepID=UPI0020A78653|nr:cellulase family glycosylhydrolase [Pyxidicoccus xibeiensis]MCP3137955.1 cellulase family glycosylhydrolase [Pyxidicoccus xibeiensis]